MPSRRVTRLYADALVWDAHWGVESSPTADLTQLDAYTEAGFGYVSLNVGYDAIGREETLRVIAHYRDWLQAHDDRYALVSSADEVRSARAAGKVAVAFDLEGLKALDGDVSLIARFRLLGVVQMLLAYNRNNLFASGCHDEDTGLTTLGRQAVAEMNRVGVTVDCSHMGYRATLEAMEASKHPTIFSHSNSYALHAHDRNIRDEQIRACAATEGVIGINGVEWFLGDTRTATMARHIEYVADLVGPAHVGLGLDACATGEVELPPYVDLWPEGEGYDTRILRSILLPQVAELAERLLRAGWAEQEVRGLLGENFFRVAAETWTREDDHP